MPVYRLHMLHPIGFLALVAEKLDTDRVKDFVRTTTSLVFTFACVFGVLFAILRATKLEVITIGHDGMAPTLFQGDHVMVWRGADPDLNDVMLCYRPGSRTERFWGRVVAKPGDRVTSNHGTLWVNNQQPSINMQGGMTFFSRERQTQLVGGWGHELIGSGGHDIFTNAVGVSGFRGVVTLRGHFLLNDNRTNSMHDSRVNGAALECFGQAVARFNGPAVRPSGFGSISPFGLL